jgi:hypothetical protein
MQHQGWLAASWIMDHMPMLRDCLTVDLTVLDKHLSGKIPAIFEAYKFPFRYVSEIGTQIGWKALKEDTPDDGLGFLSGNEALTNGTPEASANGLPASVTAASAGDTPEADDQPASGSDDRE